MVKIWNKIIILIFDMDILYGEFKKKIFIRLKIWSIIVDNVCDFFIEVYIIWFLRRIGENFLYFLNWIKCILKKK